HLSSDTTHDLTEKNKLFELIRTQSEQVADTVNGFLKEDRPVILTGDLNIAKNSLLYKSFLKSAKLNDIFLHDETPTYYPDRISYFYRSPRGRCDYIFIKSPHKTIEILETGYAFSDGISNNNGEKTYLSDHIGLQCTLEVNK